MSASSPGSVMLRAATAASGGTGAPLATYCSIWPWTVRISAWTSTPDGVASASSSMVASDVGRRSGVNAVDAQAALALDDGADRAVLQLDDLGDLGERADGVQLRRRGDVLLVRLALGHERDRPAVGDGGVQRGDALLAADLERHDHLREDDRLPERDERQVAVWSCRPVPVVLTSSLPSKPSGSPVARGGCCDHGLRRVDRSR